MQRWRTHKRILCLLIRRFRIFLHPCAKFAHVASRPLSAADNLSVSKRAMVKRFCACNSISRFARILRTIIARWRAITLPTSLYVASISKNDANKFTPMFVRKWVFSDNASLDMNFSSFRTFFKLTINPINFCFILIGYFDWNMIGQIFVTMVQVQIQKVREKKSRRPSSKVYY